VQPWRNDAEGASRFIVQQGASADRPLAALASQRVRFDVRLSIVTRKSEHHAKARDCSRIPGTVVCGLNEREGLLSKATLYNTVVIIGPAGNILNRHRKLMPTNPERMVWGFGDGSGLNVVDTPAGRIGTLLCWENYMPLARYALFSQGIEIYVAPTYDSGDGCLHAPCKRTASKSDQVSLEGQEIQQQESKNGRNHQIYPHQAATSAEQNSGKC
jgi:hypothetical protein